MERDSAAAFIEGAQNLDLSQIVRSPFSLESDIQVNATGDPRDPVLLRRGFVPLAKPGHADRRLR